MNPNYRNFALWAIIALLLIALFNLFQSPAQRVNSTEVEYSTFLQNVDNGKVKTVTIAGNRISGTYADNGAAFQTYSPSDPTLVSHLRDKNVLISARPESDGSNSLISILLSWLPMLVILGVWIFFMRQMQGGGNKALSFGKSKAKLLSGSAKKVTFKDVAGVDEAKEELQEIIEFLREPQKFQKLGGRIPKGVLLMGPPGSGKTLLTRPLCRYPAWPRYSGKGNPADAASFACTTP